MMGGMPKGVVIAGLGGGSGKSVVSVGLASLLSRQGEKVVPFKKGPDYIDAGWLSLASGTPCYNLDPFLMQLEALRSSFAEHANQGDYFIIEGNRGLYDGVDVGGTYSTAELAVSLGLPILLVVDCTKTTRTVAAMVLGCKMLDPAIEIAGVVLNRIGGRRHEKIVREAVESHAHVPVVGALPRLERDIFPMRHLGVTPFQEYEGTEEALALLAEMVRERLDLKRIKALMRTPEMPEQSAVPTGSKSGPLVRIGVLRDAAFQFYYPENLQALEREGARLIEIDSLREKELPALDALYIGGGFPETSAALLAENSRFRDSVRAAGLRGMPIYAECGGLIYLGEAIELDGRDYPLVGLFPVRFTLEKKPQAHGYTVLTARANNPFYEPGCEIKGHEFRYSRVAAWPGKAEELAFSVNRGVGFAGSGDGLVLGNVLALYTHVHAVGTPQWAPALVKKARVFAAAHQS